MLATKNPSETHWPVDLVGFQQALSISKTFNPWSLRLESTHVGGKLSLLSDRSIGERSRWGCTSVGGVWQDFGRAVIDLYRSAGFDFCAAVFARGCLHSTDRWSECPCQTTRKAGFIENHAGSCKGCGSNKPALGTSLILFPYFFISDLHNSLWFDSAVAEIFRSVKPGSCGLAGLSWREDEHGWQPPVVTAASSASAPSLSPFPTPQDYIAWAFKHK